MQTDCQPAPAHRYALYYSPLPSDPWWESGSQWLGRCALRNARREQPDVAGVPPELFEQLTCEPRRYGWHATLRAPFRLAPGRDLAQLRTTVQALAAQTQAFELPTLQVSLEGGFLSLRPAAQCPPLQALADACVRALQPLAAPLSDAELQRRRRAPLSAAQDALLTRWGYPYVLEAFAFHCSLSGALHGLDEALVRALARAANERFGSLAPARVETLALFAEPAPGADFVLLEHLRLA